MMAIVLIEKGISLVNSFEYPIRLIIILIILRLRISYFYMQIL